MTRETQIEIRTVGEERCIRAMLFRETDEFPKLCVNAGKVAYDFGQADHGQFRGVDDRFHSRRLQPRSGASEKIGLGIGFGQAGNDTGGVHIARRFAHGN